MFAHVGFSVFTRMRSIDTEGFRLLGPLLYSFHCFPVHNLWDVSFTNEDVVILNLTKDNGNSTALEDTGFVPWDEIARTQFISYVTSSSSSADSRPGIREHEKKLRPQCSKISFTVGGRGS